MLFASAIIDYDYIMNLIADSTQKKPEKQKMTKAQIISLLKSTSNLMDEEKLTDLLEPLDLGWKERRVKELSLMEDLVPLLRKLASGREISGLAAYE